METRRHCSHIYLFGHHKRTSKITRNCQQLPPLGSMRDESCFLFSLHAHPSVFYIHYLYFKKEERRMTVAGKIFEGLEESMAVE